MIDNQILSKMKIDEEIIMKYVQEGGKLFSITNIGKLRDGGTWDVRCSKSEFNFYIHKETHKFHDSYPPENDNLIIDNLLIYYLYDRLSTYIKNLEMEYLSRKELIKKITNTL